VALSFLFRLVRRTIELLRVRRLGGLEKDIEIIVLRHQLQVLHRRTPRPHFTWADRAFLALAGTLLPRHRWSSLLVTPATLLAWQRKVVRKRWTYPHRKPGHPRLPDSHVELICRLARENPRWGYQRIVGELRKLGVVVSATSVRNVLRRHGLSPAPRRDGPTWSEFLRTQAQSMLATDFFHVDTVGGRRFYALFVIELDRRVVRLLGVTTNPNGRWVTQMARNLVFDLSEAKLTIRFLIRDRDTKFTAAFDEVLRTEGIETIRTPVRAPRAKGLASHCTSWGWLGCFSLRESSAAGWNEPRITRGGRLEEMLVLVVGLVADEEAGMMPGLDGVPLHAEMRGDLVEGEQAGSSKPVPVAQKVMVAA